MTVKTKKIKILKHKFLTTAMLLGTISPTAFSQEKTNADTSLKKQVAAVVADKPQRQGKRHQMGPGKLETGNSHIDKKISQMRKDGAFYLDYRKCKQTYDVKSSVVYFTNDEIEKMGINKLPMTPFAVCRARENAVMWKGDEWKNPESMSKYQKALIKAICNINGTFNGEFQFTETNTAKAVLYGLVQRRNPELQEFCRGFIKPGVNLDEHQAFQKFRKSYLSAVEKFDNGEGSRQDLMRVRFGYLLDLEFKKTDGGIFAIMDYSKANFHKLSLQNPEMSRQMQETFAVNVYMVMSVHSEKIFNHIDPKTLGSVFAAMIHLPNDAKTVDILMSHSPEKAREKLIRIHGEPTKADKRMFEASIKVNNGDYFGSTFCRDFAWITDNPSFWEGFQQAMKKFAMKDIVKERRSEKDLINSFTLQFEKLPIKKLDVTPPLIYSTEQDMSKVLLQQKMTEKSK